MQAGDLRNRVGFYQLRAVADGYGNTESTYADDANFECAANIRPKLGGEQVLAARQGGVNLVNVTVRQSARTRVVNTSWKVVDERSGVAYNIRSIIDPFEHSADRGKWFEMLCEKGVAITQSAVVLGPGADSELKRIGAIDLALPWRPYMPIPDGTIEEDDRKVAARMYPE